MYKDLKNYRTILVTGGAGYLGSVLVKRLLEKSYRVRVLDSLLFGDEGLKSVIHEQNLELIKGDIRHIEDLTKAIKGAYGVIHLAAIVGDPACNISEDATLTVNYQATKALIDVCLHYNTRRIIFASSCSVYGASKDIIFNEGSFLNPISLYAKTRIDSEQIILNMANSSMVPTIVRLGTAYGYSDRMRFDLVLNILTAKAVMEGKITIFHPENWRPLVYVHDVADACITILEAPEKKVDREIFNVGSNEQNYQIGELGRLIVEYIPDTSLEICRESEDRRNYRVSFDKMNYVLGYKTQFTIADAVREISQKVKDGTIADYRDDRYYNVRFKEYR